MSKTNILISFLSLISFFLALEIMIRTYDTMRGFGFFSNHRDVLEQLKPARPFRIFGYDLYENKDSVKYIISRHGEDYPLIKTDKTFRIVVFGGSTTENETSFQKTGIHYPLVLQSLLNKTSNRTNIQVINVAYSAYSTAHSLILLELDVLSWDPDLIIVTHNINDLFASYWPNFTFDYSNKYSNEFYSLPDLKEIYTISNVLFQNSQLYWVLYHRTKNILGRNSYTINRKSYENDLSLQKRMVLRSC